MQVQVDEIKPEIFRISTYTPGDVVSLSTFIIRDEKPALIHTGHQESFTMVCKAAAELIDLNDLTYIFFSHIEPDETGSLKQWCEVSPNVQVCSNKLAKCIVQDTINKPAKVFKDGDTIDLGSHKLRFLETPHFPHNWEAVLFYEVTTKTLFSSDLGTQSGFPQKTGKQVNLDDVMQLQNKLGYMAVGPRLASAIAKLRELDIDTMAPMHGLELDRLLSHGLLTALELENKKAMEEFLTQQAASNTKNCPEQLAIIKR